LGHREEGAEREHAEAEFSKTHPTPPQRPS
jgi:hypothetical protein